ncbi:MAG: hypothetical protein A2Y12_04345 [Planctomycetes bacterium GWF2_42_9]|nr:MAG: hypothetical protein A2Y12_04345 [Planctomycetes bacterium GWF2_42_9]
MAKFATINDVALKAGVSKAAAWAALANHRTNINLGKETKDRIIEMAKQLNYKPNITARSLSQQKSFLIGFLCRENYGKNATELLRGMQDVFLGQGYSVIAYVHGDTAKDELCNLEHSNARLSEALIITPALERNGYSNNQEIVRLQESGIPVVQLFNKIVPNIPCVSYDNYEAGKAATNYLIEKGHKRIGHFTIADYHDEITPGFHIESKQRWMGYDAAMRSAGLEPFVFTMPDEGWPDSPCGAAKKLIAHAYRPTALITVYDSMAIYLMDGLRDAGFRVPQDMSFIGHNGDEFIFYKYSHLTTFVVPLSKMGGEAARMCLSMLEGKTVEDVQFKPEFCSGSTVAPLIIQ